MIYINIEQILLCVSQLLAIVQGILGDHQT
jgi:hypothetical protein